LLILDPVLPQCRLDHRMRLRQIPPGKLGEEMMFDLKVQTAHHGIDDRTACDIRRGQNLLPDHSIAMSCLEELSSLVVRGENGTVIKAEDALVSQCEEKPVPATQKVHEKSCVQSQVDQNDRTLKPLILRLILEEKGDARPPSVHSLEAKNEREYENLRLHQWPEPLISSDSLFGAECDEEDVNIRIFFEMVRVSMMSIMLVYPPGVGESEQEIPVHEVQDVACSLSVVEDLPVTEVMRQKCYLC